MEAKEEYEMFTLAPTIHDTVNAVKFEGELRELGDNLGIFEDKPAPLLTHDDTHLNVFKIDKVDGEFEADNTSGILGLGPAISYSTHDQSGWNIMY